MRGTHHICIVFPHLSQGIHHIIASVSGAIGILQVVEGLHLAGRGDKIPAEGDADAVDLGDQGDVADGMAWRRLYVETVWAPYEGS